MSPFTANIDEGCQRGLHVRYVLAAPVPLRLHHEVRAHFGDGVRLTEEHFGPVRVERALCPFRFEVRHGHRDRAVSLILRFTATAEQRAADRLAFESLLTQLLLLEPA